MTTSLPPLDDTAMSRRIAQLEQIEARFQSITANVPGMVYQFVLQPGGGATFPYASDGCRELFGIDPSALTASANALIALIHPDDLPGFQQSVGASAVTLEPWQWEGRFVLASGEIKWVQAASQPKLQADGSIVWDGILLDITTRKEAEEALRRGSVQDETIRSQAAILDELSTPLLPITNHVVVMPLIGTVDTRRTQLVVETLLHGVEQQRAQIAILDITGVPVVDTAVAQALINAAQAVRLLGAEAILTGVRPEVAQTLVSLGVQLTGMITHSSLQSGIAYALSRAELRNNTAGKFR